jgi:hypothetical protein
MGTTPDITYSATADDYNLCSFFCAINHPSDDAFALE